MKRKNIFWAIEITKKSPFSFVEDIKKHNNVILRISRITMIRNNAEQSRVKLLSCRSKSHTSDHGGSFRVRIFDELRKRSVNFVLCHLQVGIVEMMNVNYCFDSSQMGSLKFTFEKFGKFCNCEAFKIQVFGSVEVDEDFADVEMLRKNGFVEKKKVVKKKVSDNTKIKAPPSIRKNVKIKKDRKEEMMGFEKENDVLLKPFYRDGVKINNLIIGHGRRAHKGDMVEVYFKGKLDPRKKKTFDRCKFKNPVTFKVGSKDILKGMNTAVLGMTVGGNREVVIPSRMGFGAKGVSGKVPPYATLYYDIHVKDVTPREKVRKQEMEKQKEKQTRKRERDQRFMTKEERRLRKRRRIK